MDQRTGKQQTPASTPTHLWLQTSIAIEFRFERLKGLFSDPPVFAPRILEHRCRRDHLVQIDSWYQVVHRVTAHCRIGASGIAEVG